jgi:hypothetical protein
MLTEVTVLLLVQFLHEIYSEATVDAKGVSSTINHLTTNNNNDEDCAEPHHRSSTTMTTTRAALFSDTDELSLSVVQRVDSLQRTVLVSGCWNLYNQVVLIPLSLTCKHFTLGPRILGKLGA